MGEWGRQVWLGVTRIVGVQELRSENGSSFNEIMSLMMDSEVVMMFEIASR